MSREPKAAQAESQSAGDEVRRGKASAATVGAFTGGIGCAAIVAALIYSKRRESDGQLGRES
jgi:hypothetical protein